MEAGAKEGEISTKIRPIFLLLSPRSTTTSLSIQQHPRAAQKLLQTSLTPHHPISAHKVQTGSSLFSQLASSSSFNPSGLEFLTAQNTKPNLRMELENVTVNQEEESEVKELVDGQVESFKCDGKEQKNDDELVEGGGSNHSEQVTYKDTATWTAEDDMPSPIESSPVDSPVHSSSNNSNSNFHIPEFQFDREHHHHPHHNQSRNHHHHNQS